jgi:hypothetical protein
MKHPAYLWHNNATNAANLHPPERLLECWDDLVAAEPDLQVVFVISRKAAALRLQSV